ncbi:cyclic nucleotide-binding domain-containing protein [Rhodoferax sp. PAMC 29310]|uniref:cyclic nucleotide-binding domain-containing protein n=1 Tax=Rhodoferax sp. PAMC 29310 TaxID=2822760 RepID=UPI001B31E183|nr:cyclic nucleotide-binding domain-containing protein [Rhodoferax sp. PAMC 29310]
MKGILEYLRLRLKPVRSEQESDSVLFTTAFAGLGVDATLLIPWEARAVEIGATRMKPGRGTKMLQSLWSKDKFMHHLDSEAIARMEAYIDFATVPSNRDIIRQDEYGNFMVVVLSGSIAVDRMQPWGARLRLAEAIPGELLGEMSLLDSGNRFSACTALTECEVAVISAQALDEMLSDDPLLAANLIALLARKLSLRLRVVSARLTDQT